MKTVKQTAFIRRDCFGLWAAQKKCNRCKLANECYKKFEEKAGGFPI